jgi:hypothetical protein
MKFRAIEIEDIENYVGEDKNYTEAMQCMFEAGKPIAADSGRQKKSPLKLSVQEARLKQRPSILIHIYMPEGCQMKNKNSLM